MMSTRKPFWESSLAKRSEIARPKVIRIPRDLIKMEADQTEEKPTVTIEVMSKPVNFRIKRELRNILKSTKASECGQLDNCPSNAITPRIVPDSNSLLMLKSSITSKEVVVVSEAILDKSKGLGNTKKPRVEIKKIRANEARRVTLPNKMVDALKAPKMFPKNNLERPPKLLHDGSLKNIRSIVAARVKKIEESKNIEIPFTVPPSQIVKNNCNEAESIQMTQNDNIEFESGLVTSDTRNPRIFISSTSSNALSDIKSESCISKTKIIKSKSKSMELLRTRSASESTSVSAWRSWKEKRERPNDITPAIEPSSISHAGEKRQDCVVNKKQTKKIRNHPFLTKSNYELFCDAAGNLEGTNDIYYKFIFGGRSIREAAAKFKEGIITQVDLGKLDKMIAAAAFAKTGVYHRVVETSREKKKFAMLAAVDAKVKKLEELRVCIMTTIRQLHSRKSYMVYLEKENRKLANHHRTSIQEYLKEVSDTIESDDLCLSQIQTLSASSTNDRRLLFAEFALQLKKWKGEKKLLENELIAYQSALADLDDLSAFEENIIKDPDYPRKQIAKAIEAKDKQILAINHKLSDFKAAFRRQEEDYNAQVQKKGYALFKEAMKDYDKYFNPNSLSQYQRNLNLKEEISRQKQAQKELQMQIENYTVIRQQMTMDLATDLDPRRKVRDLIESMTCKPEMKIEISSS